MSYDFANTIDFLCSNVAEFNYPELRPHSPIIIIVCRGKEQAKEGHWGWTITQCDGMECRKRTEVEISC
jgi:hypothetical protein